MNHVSLPGVTRKQLGLSFLGETRQDFTSVIGDVCVEIEGLDRKVGSTSFLRNRLFFDNASSTGTASGTDRLTCELIFSSSFSSALYLTFGKLLASSSG